MSIGYRAAVENPLAGLGLESFRMSLEAVKNDAKLGESGCKRFLRVSGKRSLTTFI